MIIRILLYVYIFGTTFLKFYVTNEPNDSIQTCTGLRKISAVLQKYQNIRPIHEQLNMTKTSFNETLLSLTN